jgi:hypothetical protein
MVIEQEFPKFFDWLFTYQDGQTPAILVWLGIVAAIAAIGLAFSTLLAIISRGPKAGLRTVGQRLWEGTVDLMTLSPRRILGMSILAVQEALRRRVWVALVVFLLILTFAGWFLSPSVKEPAKLYLSFVLTATSFLVLAVALFLSAFSLPNDFRANTIYTVVTKPVRPLEIVLGRIFGFCFVGTVMLLLMGLVSYVFVNRALRHEHEITGRDLQKVVRDVRGERRTFFIGKTTGENEHLHLIERDPIDIAAESGWTDPANGHYHKITEEDNDVASGQIESFERAVSAAGPAADAEAAAEDDAQQPAIRVVSPGHGLRDGDLIRIEDVEGAPELNEVWVVANRENDRFVLKNSAFLRPSYQGGNWKTVEYRVSQPLGMVAARVPHYAEQIEFREKDGSQGKGISVGHEWEYRSFIEGGTLAAAIWQFEDLKAEDFEHTDGALPLELTLSVFRTHKGDIEKRVRGDIVLRNPTTELRSNKIPFTSNEFSSVSLTVSSELKGRDPKRPAQELDLKLFEDLVDEDGRLIIEVSCAESGQYFGMAKHDLFIMSRDASPGVNFFKGYLSIWLQMLLICSVGVMFSTFLNGFVALLATGALTLGGMFTGFIGELSRGETYGGGPVESFYRVLTRAPMTTPLEESATSTLMQTLDRGIEEVLWLLSKIVPDLGAIDDVDYVANGFNIPFNNLAIQFVMVLGFVVPLALMGHYILKGRETAR